MKTNIKEAEKLLELAILSNYIAGNGERKSDLPFSVILIADPELNKTRELMRFSGTPNISVQSDLTYIGMINDVLPKIARNEIKTIIIPDLLKCVQKKTATAQNFVNIINIVIEEGVYAISLKNIYDFKGARANILTSITPEIYFDARTRWSKIGFFSRVLPFTYTYTDGMKARTFKAIGKYEVDDSKIDVEIPTYPEKVEIAQRFTRVAEEHAKILGKSEQFLYRRGKKVVQMEGSVGFRHKWQIMALLKSLALRRGDDRVRIKDVREFEKLSRWINYEFNPIGPM